jgi:DNA gyrase subunit B
LIEEQAESYAVASRLVPLAKSTAAAQAAETNDEMEAEIAETASNKGIQITRPSELLDAILKQGAKGLSTQRYKGLGEMNADQLWETTLDPDNRSLLRVQVEQADMADEIFTQLMGDVVEPRRDFIQENALNVENLDV